MDLPQPKTQSNASRVAQLIRAGVLKPAELPLLRMALQNHPKVGYDTAKLPKMQRVVLDKVQSAMTTAALSSPTTFSAVRRGLAEAITKDPPMVLVLKRQGIRLFADGKRVALYSNDDLNLHFSIPYDANGPQSPVGIAEEIEVEVERLDEARVKIVKARIRGGKVQRRKKVSNVPGYTIRGGKLVKMSPKEKLDRKRGQRRGKLKRKAKAARAMMARKRSMRKRKAMGL